MAESNKGSSSGGQSGGSGDVVEAAAASLIEAKKEFIQTFFKRAEEFTETLLRENERLRFQILELEEKLHARDFAPFQESNATGALRDLLSRVESLEQEREQMLTRFRSVQ